MSQNIQEAIYRSDAVEVTKTLVRVGGTSYPINGIGSVFIRAPNNSSYFGGVLLAVIGLFVAVSNESGGAVISCLVVGSVLAIMGVLQPHTLILKTSSGDQQALRSRNTQSLREVKAAIEAAVSQRG